MSFEHDQFARFMISSSSHSSRNGRPSSVVYPQRPPVLARAPRRVTIKLDGTVRRRRAQMVVTLRLALLCGWLLHELIVNFDESRCLQIASPFSVAAPPLRRHLSSESVPSPSAENVTDEKAAEGKAMENNRRRLFRPIKTVEVQTPPNTVGHSPLPSPSSTVRSPSAVGGDAQRHSLHRSTDSAKNAVVPKRRRKVILRRKLLRKGATAGDWQQKKKNKNGHAKIGAVRRVVWRVVPLQRLPPAEEGQKEKADDNTGGRQAQAGANAEQGQRRNNNFDAFPFENEFAMPTTGNGGSNGGTAHAPPVRTKTGTVMVRRTDRGGGSADGSASAGGRRRMARQRTTTAPRDGQRAKADANAANEPFFAHLAMANAQQPSSIGRRPLRLPLFHLSVPSVAHQLVSLLSVGLCLFRAIFDCWALLQCFCCALFLLGLYLRCRPLALLPIAIDVISIVLAVLFTLCLVVFLLVLLLLAHSVLPPLSLLRCVLFTSAVCIGVTLFTLCVFCEQSAVGEMAQKKRRKRGEKKRNIEGEEDGRRKEREEEDREGEDDDSER